MGPFRVAVFCATVCLLPVLSLAQIGMISETRTEIRGSVRDSETHLVLTRVTVSAQSEDSGDARQAETDSSGRFALSGLMVGSYVVSAKLSGYVEMSQTLDLRTNPMPYLSFELRRIPGSGPPAVAPEGPGATLNARLASVPDKAKKEFSEAQELWQRGKDMQACVDHLNKAIRDYPKFADAYVLLASADMQMNNVAEAKTAVAKAIDIDPKLADARFTLGKIQNREKDYAHAEQTLTEGLKLDNASAEGHYELARAYFAENKIPDADTHAGKAAALQPNLAPVYILLGNIALRKQDAEGALKEYQKYLKLDPNGPMGQAAQAMVKKIQDALDPVAKQ
jgi:predicted Zn-dependent protease